jgi:hypothetical protein
MGVCGRCGTIICLAGGECRSKLSRRLGRAARVFSVRAILGGIAIGLFSPIIIGTFWFGA